VKTHHISVCICAFKRGDLLRQLLVKLENQQTEGLFSYSVVVADNDSSESAKEVVSEFCSTYRLPVNYCVESRQNIALARNKALQHAEGDFVAFMDDDEFPEENWLCSLFKASVAYGADGVLGPVKPHFELDPPSWVKKGGFFDRPAYETGYRLDGSETRTGNVLFRKEILDGVTSSFESEFDAAGEDVDFFYRMLDKGCAFIWCNEAVVYEVVPSSRCTRSYLLRRALLRGSNFPKQRKNRIKNAVKSLIAVPCYALALPFLIIVGQHVFLNYLIKLLDHVSRLFAFLGVRLVTRRQT
jgi:succinoglycan biosynthesis protein ExoM